MRITVDIDEAILNDLVAMTGESKKSPAISKVVTDWVKRQKAKAFGKRIMEGYYDYPSTNEEIEKLDR
jgi:hypothetical protein